MAFEYSGWLEVPRGESFGGGTVRVPFVFQSDNILESTEREDYLSGLYETWRGMLVDYDESRKGNYGDMINHRFTSIIDLGFGPAEGEPHFGR
jgi:hypothetical protein